MNLALSPPANASSSVFFLVPTGRWPVNDYQRKKRLIARPAVDANLRLHVLDHA